MILAFQNFKSPSLEKDLASIFRSKKCMKFENPLLALDETEVLESQKYIVELLSCRFFIHFKIESIRETVRHWESEIF